MAVFGARIGGERMGEWHTDMTCAKLVRYLRLAYRVVADQPARAR